MTGVEPAFGLLLLFPPPAPGAFGLTGSHCAGTRRTADREKALVVQSVVRNAMVANERDNAVARPIEQRVHLDYPILGINPGISHRCPIGGLVGAQSGDPGRSAGQCTTEQRHLAYSTAGEPGFQ